MRIENGRVLPLKVGELVELLQSYDKDLPVEAIITKDGEPTNIHDVSDNTEFEETDTVRKVLIWTTASMH